MKIGLFLSAKPDCFSSTLHVFEDFTVINLQHKPLPEENLILPVLNSKNEQCLCQFVIRKVFYFPENFHNNHNIFYEILKGTKNSKIMDFNCEVYITLYNNYERKIKFFKTNLETKKINSF